ncbi:MAG: Hpt domain-containing protein [Planctomycetes bacterium]|nr:Hpt domain-containing protein [Planctomycetota bacterium]
MDHQTQSSADLDGVVDAETIESLKSLCDPGDLSLFHDLIDTYLADSPTRLEAVEAALATNDAGAMERAAHGLRSSSANMGALGLASLCKQLETLGRGGQIDGAAELVARARSEFDRIRTVFLRLRG